MRRTRREYFESLPFRQPKASFDDVLALVKRQIKRKAIADGLIVDPAKRPPRCKWAWELPAAKTVTFNMEEGTLLGVKENPTGGIVDADTRSEARSLIKSKLGLRKKDRLPVGITIIEVEGSAS